MKKVVKIRESQLNDIIKKVIMEQEGQVMTSGPSPEQMTGTPEDGSEDTTSEGPNFEEFLSCAKTLLGQGVTIGNLVDQLVEAQGGEPEVDPEAEPDNEGGVEPESPMNENRKRR